MHNLIQSNHNNGNKVIDHYLAVHGYVPLWVLFTIATFGNISVFYANLKDREKDLIAAHYGLRARELSSIMYFLTNARNACAHGHRIYTLGADVRCPLTIPHMELHQQLNLSRYAGKRDVLAVVIACFYLLPEDDFTTLIQTLKQHMQNVKQTCFYSGIINKANLRISYLDALSQLKRQNFYPY